jgi:hypothetical protein
MRGESSVHIGVVCEGPQDLRLLRAFLPCWARVEISWMADFEPHQIVPDIIRLQGATGDDECLYWKDVGKRCEEIETAGHAGFIKVPHGEFRALEHAGEAATARRAMLLFRYLKLKRKLPLDVIILMRDTDDQLGRVDALRSARKDAEAVLKVVIGAAHTKRECWVLAGFEPENDDERAALEAQRATLGYHPQQESHRLTASGSSGKHNAKAIIDALGIDEEREARCLAAALPLLRERGAENGLRDFLDDLAARVAPLL